MRIPINTYIEHTLLKPDAAEKDFLKLIEEAKQYKFHGICVPGFWVKKAARELHGSDVKLVTVAGFPLGYQMTEVKMEEMRLAIRDGADELDIVMNISAFKTGLPWVKIELAKCANLAHESGVLLKVILETAYLTDEEVIRACKICTEAGVDFVKTSTGFAAAGATVHHVQLMRDTVPEHIGVKAAGGIKSWEDAMAMIEAGADRLGTSSGISILETAPTS